MIVDSSVIVAVVATEPEWEGLLDAMTSAAKLRMSVANWLECFIVVESKNVAATTRHLEAMFTRLRMELVSVTADQAQAARTAYRRFGRGRHPAGLNYGDCFAYALAKSMGEPLLFKGGDFSQTDIEPALTS